MLDKNLNLDEPEINQKENKQITDPLILNFDIVTKRDNNKEKELKNTEDNKEMSFQDKISEKIGSVKSFFKRERLGFIYCLLAQFLWTSNSIYVKFITQYYKPIFKNKTFLFPRGLLIIIISYFLGKHFDVKYINYQNFLPK